MKKLFDITIILILLPLWTPVFVIIYLLVLTNLGSPAFFYQKRPGQHGKIFSMVKFRSMVDAYDEEGHLLPDEIRLTKFGKFLRSSSLDELPELWNVLKGDMSLVGPRPLLIEYLPLYSPEQSRRHNVPPGITGWAQINGRNAINWEEKFKLDVWYVDNQSIWVDIKILLLTVQKVLMRDGISAERHVTIEPFRGTHDEKIGNFRG
jgi:lipopolysaccharide/colanic/teichoic acid biosynthesis glycosyltransferase